MKKIISTFLVVALTFTISACSGAPKPVSDGSNTLPKYTLANTGGDSDSWFYEKFNFKSNNIDGEWFDRLGDETVSAWCDEYDRQQKSGAPDNTYPALVQFAKDLNVSEETFREVMRKIKNNEEKSGLSPMTYLTDEEIQIVYSDDIEKINEAFVSEYCIFVNGNILTPEWLLNHSVSEHKNKGVAYEHLKNKLDGYYATILDSYDEGEEFLSIFQNKLQDLK